ncbi:hypothetical protein H5410_003387 [Solanum commersonii]|uniref:Reverse transcriptase zinc-binding domain-containing protein n=1 Tax=Solanum commersonii TaxID=4109 RepID=A0A9J6B4J0_SOLCO|nr:hypothetical protein H5410_003387 [Solanum commersonii]
MAMKIIRKASEEWDEFLQHTRLEVGNDARIKFWIDSWSGDENFKSTFPDLLRFALNREVWVIRRDILFSVNSYKLEQETVEHLFLHYNFSRQCWALFSEYYWASLVIPWKINSLLDVWQAHKRSLNRYVGLFPFAYYGCLAGKEDML